LAKVNELAGEINKANDEQEKLRVKMQEQLDANETKLKEYEEDRKKSKIVSIQDYFKQELKDSEGFEAFKANSGNKTMLFGKGEAWESKEQTLYNMIHKATMLQSTTWTGDVVVPDRVSNVTWALPHERVRIRSLMPFGSTASSVVSFVQSTSTRNAATVSEGNAKPQSQEDLAEVQEPVQVIAHTFKISKQALEDYAQMSTYLSTEGVAGLKDVEDTQLLNGSGVTPNLNGIITQAATTFVGGLSTDTDLDTLLKAVYTLKLQNFFPSAILVPTAKMRDIKLIKDTSGQYIFPNFLPTGLANPVSVDGVPVIEHTAMPDDTFLCGDFTRATGFDREAVNVRFAEENEDDFLKNLISIRIEERLALAVYRPEAFTSATFTNAQSILT
jgi:HK97 family phage major capsid protein